MDHKPPLPLWVRIGLIAAVVLVAAGALGLTWVSRLEKAGAEFPRYAAMPAFTLTNQNGKQVSSDELKGKLLFVGFIYTSCPDICPMLTSQMKGLQDDLRKAGLLGSDVALISISVDPGRDTPAVLKTYAAQHGADTATWHFLTGDESYVRNLVTRGFLVGMEKAPAGHEGHSAAAPAAASDYAVNHSGRIALVDRTGQIRRYYDSQDFDPARIILDLQKLR